MEFHLNLDKDFTFKVGAHTWFCKVTEDIPGTTEEVWGWCDPDIQTIYLHNKAPYSLKLSTFIHEVLHVLEGIYEIKMSHKDINITGDALAQVLIDNFSCKK